MKEKILEIFIKTLIREKTGSPGRLLQLKRIFAKRYGFKLPSNITLLAAYRQMVKKGRISARGRRRSIALATERGSALGGNGIEKLLKRREIRTLSGVSIITVLTKPFPCPGKC
jgi:histone acetyltransferase (RNA polymerase elongator complex component)